MCPPEDVILQAGGHINKNLYSKCCYRGLYSKLFCNPLDCSPPGSSVHGILQARILEWVAMPSYRGSEPGIVPAPLTSPALAGRFFTTSITWKAQVWTNTLKNQNVIDTLTDC